MGRPGLKGKGEQEHEDSIERDMEETEGIPQMAHDRFRNQPGED